MGAFDAEQLCLLQVIADKLDKLVEVEIPHRFRGEFPGRKLGPTPGEILQPTEILSILALSTGNFVTAFTVPSDEEIIIFEGWFGILKLAPASTVAVWRRGLKIAVAPPYDAGSPAPPDILARWEPTRDAPSHRTYGALGFLLKPGELLQATANVAGDIVYADFLIHRRRVDIR